MFEELLGSVFGTLLSIPSMILTTLLSPVLSLFGM